MLTDIEKSAKTIYATVDFVDIAGLVKGAASGAGLGNKFLSEIQGTDAIAQVVRVFEGTDIIHVNNKIDPKDDIEVLNLELVLKDLEILEKYVYGLEKRIKAEIKVKETFPFFEGLVNYLKEGKLAKGYIETHETEIEDEFIVKTLKEIRLLTAKPMLYVANVSETQVNMDIEELRVKMGLAPEDIIIPLSVKLENEIASLAEGDKELFMSEYGLTMSGLDRLTKKAYEILGLISYFTTGIDESHAWTVKNGSNAKEASREIHTDFYDRFIAAEVIGYNDFIASRGYKGSKEQGKLRLESKDYIVKDGDIIEFKFGAK